MLLCFYCLSAEIAPPSLSSPHLCIYSQHLRRRFLWSDCPRGALQAFSNEISISHSPQLPVSACFSLFFSFSIEVTVSEAYPAMSHQLLVPPPPASTGNTPCGCVPGGYTPPSEFTTPLVWLLCTLTYLHPHNYLGSEPVTP